MWQKMVRLLLTVDLLRMCVRCRYFTFFEQCENPKACSILLRGPSKDVLNEVERNLHDAMGVARNVMMDPRLLPGGGTSIGVCGAMSLPYYLWFVE